MIMKNGRRFHRAVWMMAGVLLLGLITSFATTHQTFAQFGGVTDDFLSGNTASCAPGNLLNYSVAVSELTAGQDVYVKTNAANLKTDIQVYVQTQDGACRLVAKVNANDKQWTKAGRITGATAGSEVSLVLAGSNLGADIYASVATVLLVPPGYCDSVKTQCQGTFNGQTGAIEPVTVSAPGEFVTVQTVPSLAAESIAYVEYYDGGEFLYVTKDIQPVNKNYLRGGDRTVKKAVYLSNNRLFTITETVSMPKDPLYSQYLKSTFYRLGGQARAVVMLLGIGVTALLIVFIVRRIHAWRTYRTGHGIDAYLKTHK